MIEIPLTQGKRATVDDIDADLAQLRWCAANNRGYTWYAMRGATRGGKKCDTVRMHRVILGRAIGRPLHKGEVVDHINRNGLDNRRENLRLVSFKLSSINRRKVSQFGGKPPSSAYRGVSWDKKHSKWRAQIRVGGENHYLGYFINEIDAANAYNEAATGFHGAHAQLNYLEKCRKETRAVA